MSSVSGDVLEVRVFSAGVITFKSTAPLSSPAKVEELINVLIAKGIISPPLKNDDWFI